MRLYKLLFSLIALFSIFMLSPKLPKAQENAPSKYSMSYIDSTVRVQKPESEGWVTAESSMTLIPGDKVQTADKSKAELRTPSGGILRFDQNSSIWLRNPEDSLNSTFNKLQLIEGDFWINIARRDSSISLAVLPKIGNVVIIPLPETTATVLRISVGTDSTFEVKAYSGLTRLDFNEIDSTADLLNRQSYPRDIGYKRSQEDSTGNYSIILNPNQKVIATSSGKIVFKGEFTPNDIDEKCDWVEWNKGRDAGH
jgi:hypothetical protein